MREKTQKKLVKSSRKVMYLAKPLIVRKKILIADDDESLRDIFSIIFETAGYDIEIKDNAAEIFTNEFTLPDIFLIDKLLSGIDGLDVCRHLKSDPNTTNIPVVMVSASPDISTVALNAGADDFVEKPFEVSYLLHVIERNINKSKGKRSSRRTVSSEK